jgi:hypothetical protein
MGVGEFRWIVAILSPQNPEFEPTPVCGILDWDRVFF